MMSPVDLADGIAHALRDLGEHAEIFHYLGKPPTVVLQRVDKSGHRHGWSHDVPRDCTVALDPEAIARSMVAELDAFLVERARRA